MQSTKDYLANLATHTWEQRHGYIHVCLHCGIRTIGKPTGVSYRVAAIAPCEVDSGSQVAAADERADEGRSAGNSAP